MPQPFILVTNDDGIESPGLAAAVRSVSDLGEVLVVAPREQQTSMGRAFKGRGRARPYDFNLVDRKVRAFAVRTSPAVTVRHAVLLIADRAPDLIISGINYGENMGSGLTISGTVGAALEGAAFGLPALAVSLQTPLGYHRTHSTEIDFRTAAHFTRLFARRILERGMPRGADVINVNIPQAATRRTAWRWTRVSHASYFRSTVIETRGHKRFGGYELVTDNANVEKNSDIQAIMFDRVVSVSPLTNDLTARVPKTELDKWGSEPKA